MSNKFSPSALGWNPAARVVSVFGMLLLAGIANAQSTTATIVGTVSDPSGAVVPGVSVVATNIATGYTRESATNAGGDYVLSNLPIGPYTLRATKEGFKAAIVERIVLSVDQESRINLSLPVGTVNETVEVSGIASLLQTENANLGQVVENKLIVQLPLNGRSYEQLILLAPGTVARGNAAFSGLPKVSVNGGRDSQVGYRLDGLDNSDQSFFSGGMQPSIDAIQEFKLQSPAYDAENGRGGACQRL
jgi:hypothetical protein